MAPSGGPQAIDMQPSAEAVPIRPVMAEPIEVHMLGLGVVGIVRDQHAAKLAKRVLFLSQVLVGIQLVLAVVAIVRNHGILFVLVGLFFNLIHPTCGYFGVRKKDSGLLCLNLNSGDKFFQGRWREYWVLGDNQEERSQLTSFWREDTEGNEVKMRKNKNDSINSMIRMQNGINMSSMLQSSRLNQEMSALADTLNDDNFKDGTVIGIAVDTSSV